MDHRSARPREWQGRGAGLCTNQPTPGSAHRQRVPSGGIAQRHAAGVWLARSRSDRVRVLNLETREDRVLRDPVQEDRIKALGLGGMAQRQAAGVWLARSRSDRVRVLNLETREDRWLRYPVQQDELQASGWRDLLPRHVFTPDDRAVIANVDGRIVGIDLAGGGQT